MFEVVEEYVNMNYEGLFWDLMKVNIRVIDLDFYWGYRF